MNNAPSPRHYPIWMVAQCLEVLIAKKRAIKQAVMQQLLTGKTRLPGFSGAWETKRLGEIAHIKQELKTTKTKTKADNILFLFARQLLNELIVIAMTVRQFLFRVKRNRKHFSLHQWSFRLSSTCLHDQPILGWCVWKINLLYHGSAIGSHAMQNTVKATVDSLRLPTFKNFSLSIPKGIAEQHAIASVLSDMDAEIAVLEQRRDKTRAIKQGMMQQLLTGRMRLVKPNTVSNRSRKQEPK